MTKNIFYSIHEYPKDDRPVGACVTEGYSRQAVINKATAYYKSITDCVFEDRDWGEFDMDVILLTLDETGDEPVETLEKITLEWALEKPFCPHREWGYP